MSECDRKGKFYGGCKFEPRYDLSPADISRFVSMRGDMTDMLETIRQKTYIKDVCVTCGKEIAR